MDFSGLTSWVTSQAAGLLAGIVAILVVLAFFRRDWKEIFIVAIAAGSAYFLVTQGPTVFGWIGNIINKVSGG